MRDTLLWRHTYQKTDDATVMQQMKKQITMMFKDATIRAGQCDNIISISWPIKLQYSFRLLRYIFLTFFVCVRYKTSKNFIQMFFLVVCQQTWRSWHTLYYGNVFKNLNMINTPGEFSNLIGQTLLRVFFYKDLSGGLSHKLMPNAKLKACCYSTQMFT